MRETLVPWQNTFKSYSIYFFQVLRHSRAVTDQTSFEKGGYFLLFSRKRRRKIKRGHTHTLAATHIKTRSDVFSSSYVFLFIFRGEATRRRQKKMALFKRVCVGGKTSSSSSAHTRF